MSAAVKELVQRQFLDNRNKSHSTFNDAYVASNLNSLTESIGRELKVYFPSAGTLDEMARLLAVKIRREFVIIPRK
jgi:hypothetical protein